MDLRGEPGDDLVDCLTRRSHVPGQRRCRRQVHRESVVQIRTRQNHLTDVKLIALGAVPADRAS
jgi:hypothetical protein